MTTDWGDDVWSALAFNEDAQLPTVMMLLDDAERALAAARLFLAAHTREPFALACRDSTRTATNMA
ncbi:hypothetical protein ACH4Y0_02310 [Streptomyces sp. NPDC020707]|uniref:hypothetical protein n=1 Tax=Streptomyces sp. NPDC020707 TaxID=3365084 RepID=UPI00379DABF7